MNDREEPKRSSHSEAKDSTRSPRGTAADNSSVQSNQSGQPPRNSDAPKKITFDDFQIQKTIAQQQVDEERRAWQDRQRRLDEQKKGFLQQVVPRLRSIKEDMIGGKKKKRGLFGPKETEEDEPTETAPKVIPRPYYAEVEQLNIRVAKASRAAEDKAKAASITQQTHTKQPTEQAPPPKESLWDIVEQQRPEDLPQRNNIGVETFATEFDEDDYADETEQAQQPEVRPVEAETFADEYDESDYIKSEEFSQPQVAEPDPILYADSDSFDEEEEYDEPVTEHPEPESIFESNKESFSTSLGPEQYPSAPAELANQIVAPQQLEHAESTGQEAGWLLDEPEIHSSFKVYLDALRAFDSTPRRSSESRDPRVDFVTILSEALEILKEHVGALSTIFFWVNNKKNELVLECAALDDIAHQYISKDRKIPIDLDAVSVAVTRKKPELHSTISAQAELDLVPYYTDAIGIRSLAIMPVIFGESLVGVITVDSLEEEQFSAETLRILTDHSRLVSGLIRSYVEKYDLLASARTLEAARKLHQIVSPDSSARAVRDQRKNPDWIFRALMEAAGDIVDWEWLATVSFDDMRRIWTLSNVQSRHAKQYLLPQTPVSMNESIVGKCLQNGKSVSIDSLTQQHIRFSVEEVRSSAAGHSFLAIPIRTSNKNYGVLAIEHPERHRFSEADLETLEHLARSAAAALEVTALSEIVSERALTDLLTGVLNKRGMLQRLNEELSRAMEFDEPLTLVIFEIDGAAEFFSRFSQEDVDTIVLSVTRLLKFGARTFDVISRIGDHRFAALLVKMPDEEGFLWSEKMRKMVVGEVIAIGRRSFSVTISAGVSGARREGSVDELIEGAELAVERAKELGGNNVIVY